MMKEINNVLIRIILVLALVFATIFSSYDVKAASTGNETLKDLKNQLSELKAKKKAQEDKKDLTEAQIKDYQKKSENAHLEMIKAQEQVEEVNKNIEKTNAEIEVVKKESAELLVLNQKTESENIYLSYITGASTMTELIMRSDMIDMLTNYNNSKLKELELLTENNKKLNKSLEDYQKELEEKRKEYDELADKLGDELAKIDESAVTIDEEIENTESLIKYYQNYGCKDNDILSVCVASHNQNNTGWLKPVPKGVITSLFGYREAPTPTTGNNHTGIDIGVSEGTGVYAAANGIVGAIVLRSSCGGNKVYIWTTVNGKKYTYAYLHLKTIDVKVGDEVNVNQIVAHSGGRSYGYDTCTTGPHLHFGISEGHWFGAAGDLALSKFNSYLINPPGFPGLGQWFYGR